MIKTQVTDGDGKDISSHVHQFNKGVHAGQLVLTEKLARFDPEFHPFLNDDFGTAMNQAVVFTGGSEVITNGSDSSVGWSEAIVAGVWDFNAPTGKTGSSVSLTSANNNDEATFSDTGSTDFGAHTAVTGQLRLETFDATVNSINLQFQLANVDVGTSVNLNDFVDTGFFDAYQGFVIPKSRFNITTDFVDELDVSVARIGGPKPTFRLDDVQIEVSGDPIVYTVTTPRGTVFCVTELRIAIADALTGITTVVGATENATVPNLAFNKLLDVTSLQNGIVFQRTQNAEVKFSVSIKQLSDFLATGSDLINHISDGTNTFITLLVKFPEPIVLNGDTLDNLTFTINDDLSGLTIFTAAARGSIKKIDKESILNLP